MLATIQAVTSLRAAEFRIHSKCQKDYTRICPTKAKRAKSDSEIVEELGDDFNIFIQKDRKKTITTVFEFSRMSMTFICSALLMSYRYVGWISSTLKKDGCSTTNIIFLPVIRNPITEFSTVIECIYQSQKYANACNMRYSYNN